MDEPRHRTFGVQSQAVRTRDPEVSVACEPAPTPRPYQIEAAESALGLVLQGKSCAIIIPTGGGKTIASAYFVHLLLKHQPNWRVLFVAPRGELVSQAVRAFKSFGLEVGVERSKQTSTRSLFPSQVVIGTVQSVSQKHRMSRMPQFDVLIFDELHHVAHKNTTYRAIIETWPKATRLGLSATPSRADKIKLSRYFAHEAFKMTLPDGISEGWLVDAVQEWVQVAGFDLDRIAVVAGEMNQKELEDLVHQDPVATQIAAATVEFCGNEKTLIFTPGVASARKVAGKLRKLGVKAESLDGSSNAATRELVLAQFASGEVTCLCGCDLFLEGFDEPTIRHLVNAKPVKSVERYIQMLGRGLRPLKSVVRALGDASDAAARRAVIAASEKPLCRIWDLTGASNGHNVCQLADLYDGEDSEEVRKVLRANPKVAEGKTFTEAAKAAMEMIRVQKESDAKAYIPIFAVRTVVPLSGGNPNAAVGGSMGKSESYTCSEGQANQLRNLKHSPAGHSPRSASLLIDTVKKMRDGGPPSDMMGRRLNHCAGIDWKASNLCYSEVSVLLDLHNMFGEVPLDISRADMRIRKNEAGRYKLSIFEKDINYPTFRDEFDTRQHFRFLLDLRERLGY